MIATILPSSTTFHAVDYNERKVSEGVAELLEMKNFGSIGKIDPYRNVLNVTKSNVTK